MRQPWFVCMVMTNEKQRPVDYPVAPGLMPRQPNKSLINGLKVLQFVISFPDSVGVSAVAKELGMEPTKVHRLLRTLAASGYLRQIKGRKYAPDTAIAVLAAQALQGTNFIERVYPVLDELHETTGMLVAYGMLWNRQVTYLYHAKPEIKGGMGLAGHTVVEATLSRLGLVMLASLSDHEITQRYADRDIPGFGSMSALLAKLKSIREQGYAYDSADSKGTKTVAISFEKQPMIAIGISGKITPNKRDHWVERLREVEKRIG